MCAGNEIVFDFKSLSSEQWERTRRQIIARAEAARAQALGELFAAVLYGLWTGARAAGALARFVGGAVIATAGKGWRAYALWRERKAAARELHALDDRTLKDLGINRSEIEWVVRGPHTTTRLRDATIAAKHPRPRPATPTRSGTSANARSSTKQWTNKHAA
jgi:uncharacterized protein YjiS (DUF1127 family)